MPEYVCSVCSNNFLLYRRQRKGFLEGSELFCSLNCVSEYIQSLPLHSGYALSSVRSVNVSTELCIYDQITDCWYRSWFEIYFARFLLSEKVPFEYETVTFTKDTFGGISHYTPDFWLPAQKLFVEVKGMWLMSAKRKVNEVRKVAHLIVIPYYLYPEFRRKYGLANETKACVR